MYIYRKIILQQLHFAFHVFENNISEPQKLIIIFDLTPRNANYL